MLKPLTISYVLYEENDLIGLGCALLSLTPIFAIVSFVTVIILRRDFQTIFALVGQLLSVLLNIILKNVIQEIRPSRYSEIVIGDRLTSEYGMPSAHSQFLFHLATYYGMQLLFRSFPLPKGFKLLYFCGAFTLAIAVSWSRIYLDYHTSLQVIVGGLVGMITGLVWYLLELNTSAVISRVAFRQPLGQWLGIRDYSSFGYTPMQEYQLLYHPRKDT